MKSEATIKGCITANFVDDVAMVMWAKSNLTRIAYHTSKFWTRVVYSDLRLRLNSGKCEFVPHGKPALAALRG